MPDKFDSKSPKSMPLSPRQIHVVGSMQTDQARMTALNAKAVASNRYNNDNLIFTADTDRYGADTDNWNRVGPNMPQPDKTNCYNLLTSGYQALQDEHDLLGAAFGHIGVGQQDIINGDNATTDADKIAWYNSAENHFNAAITCCQQAETKHTNFNGYMTQAEAILDNYG